MYMPRVSDLFINVNIYILLLGRHQADQGGHREGLLALRSGKCWQIMSCVQLIDDNFKLQDNSGTIENEELKGFLKDLLELVKKVGRVNRVIWNIYNVIIHPSQDDYDAQDLAAFEETIMRGVGHDKHGKISRKELTMILLTLAKISPEDEQ